MKNNIAEDEYLLLTHQLLPDMGMPEDGKILEWQIGSNSYDLGEVKYSYSSLAKWYEKVPEPEIPEMIIHRVKNPLVHSIQIAAPMEVVYDSLIDLNQRKNYMVGLKSIEVNQQELNRLNRICTTFKCAMEHEQCTFETSGVEFEEDRLKFSETFKKYPMTFEYGLERQNGNTNVRIMVHTVLKFPMNLLFNIVMKRKFISETNQSLRQLKTYCEQKNVLKTTKF